MIKIIKHLKSYKSEKAKHATPKDFVKQLKTGLLPIGSAKK